MKKKRSTLVCGVLAMAMVLTGTGYAFWTDTLNVTTKATTGELAVTFADLGLLAQYNNEETGYGWSIVDGIERAETNGFISEEYFQRGKNYNIIAKAGTIESYKAEATPYNNIDFNAELVNAAPIARQVGTDYTIANTNGSDQIVISVDNMYPSYAQAFRTDILNVGTLAAKLSNIKFGVTALQNEDETKMDLTDEAKNMIGIAILVDKEAYKPAEPHKIAFKLCDALGNADNTFTIGGVDFLRLSALEGNEEAIKAAIENANLLASPGSDNRMDLFLGIAMDPDEAGKYTTGSTSNLQTDKDDSKSEMNGVTITLDMLWDQFNEGVVADVGGNHLEDQNRETTV